MDIDDQAAERVWWRVYSESIRNRKGSHPTTAAEAKAAKIAADGAVLKYREDYA